jgi:hypothetical protein
LLFFLKTLEDSHSCCYSQGACWWFLEHSWGYRASSSFPVFCLIGSCVQVIMVLLPKWRREVLTLTRTQSLDPEFYGTSRTSCMRPSRLTSVGCFILLIKKFLLHQHIMIYCTGRWTCVWCLCSWYSLSLSS